jgi:hypothetical protein
MSIQIAVPSGNGGARPNSGGVRPGAGRPPGSKNNPNPEGRSPPPQISREALESYGASRAALEETKAKSAELHYQIKLSKYVDRESVRAVSAMVLSMFAQRMRLIPDEIERRCNASPEIIQMIRDTIDEALTDLANSFKLLGGE